MTKPPLQRLLSTTLVALLAAALATPADAAPPTVTVAPGTIKFLSTDPPPTASQATLSAARNEFEPFQIVIAGGASGVAGVQASASSLSGPGGATIPAADLRLYREAYINITTPSYQTSARGPWPDALVPAVDELYGETRNAFPFDVPAGQNRVIWVDVYVPQGTPAGSYQGTVTLTGTGLGTAPVPVALTVWPFDLPSTASLATTFGMGWDDACLQEVGSYSACGDAGVIASHLRYARFALDHRVTVDTVYTGPSALSGGAFDWSTWDATYGPLLDGTAQTLLPGAQQTTARFEWASTTAHYAAWAQHFKAKGWFARTYDYTCDEPPAGCSWSSIPTLAATVHGGDPAFPVLVTTTLAHATANGVLSSINWLVPIINDIWDKGGSDTRSSYDGWLSSPDTRLFMYQSCMSEGCSGGSSKSYSSYFTGWPSYMIDAPASLNRAMEWQSFLEGMSGELYYETTFAYGSGNDPWQNQFYFGGNGDGTLFYPGTVAKIGGRDPVPVASIRLKLIREGMEDYEYLKLLESLGGGGDAVSIARGVMPNTYTVGTGDAIMAARAQLAADIMSRLGSPPPPDAGVPPIDAGIRTPDAHVTMPDARVKVDARSPSPDARTVPDAALRDAAMTAVDAPRALDAPPTADGAPTFDALSVADSLTRFDGAAGVDAGSSVSDGGASPPDSTGAGEGAEAGGGGADSGTDLAPLQSGGCAVAPQAPRTRWAIPLVGFLLWFLLLSPLRWWRRRQSAVRYR
jgi:hypothetical protein